MSAETAYDPSKRHVIIGSQLQKAREIVELSYADVAKHLGITPQEIPDWETERARPSLQQLELLAKLYGREIDYFLKKTPTPPAKIQFRSITQQAFRELSEEARVVIGRFDELCRIAFEFERMLGKIQTEVERAPLGITPTELALQQRNQLGLGDKPIGKLRDCLTQNGIRVFELPVPPEQFSGFSYWHPDYGPCILINGRELSGRRNFTLAHEYAHLLYGHPPSVCDIREEGKPGRDPDERLADIFAIEFLMPVLPVRKDFSKRGLSTRPSIRDIGNMAGTWHVSVQAMLYRLEDFELIERGYSDSLLASHEAKPWRRKGRRIPRWQRRVGKTFIFNALEAYHDGYISLGKLARSLELPLRSALEVAERGKGVFK